MLLALLRRLLELPRRQFEKACVSALAGTGPSSKSSNSRGLENKAKTPPFSGPGAPPARELDALAILADHPSLLEAAEELNLLSLLTDPRLRDMYSAARTGRSLLEALPEDPQIAQKVLSGAYADIEKPQKTLREIISNLTKDFAFAELRKQKKSLEPSDEMARLPANSEYQETGRLMAKTKASKTTKKTATKAKATTKAKPKAKAATKAKAKRRRRPAKATTKAKASKTAKADKSAKASAKVDKKPTKLSSKEAAKLAKQERLAAAEQREASSS